MIDFSHKPKFLRLSRIVDVFQPGRFLPLVVLLVSLLVTFQLWQSEQSEAEQVLQTEFNFRVLEVTRLIEQRMQTYEQLLRGLQGFFAAAERVGRAEFHTYANTLNLEKTYPGVQGLSFTLLLTKEEKESHIAAVRSRGFPLYSIRPEGLRDLYTPVVFIEPFSGKNLSVLGYDNYADPLRREAMLRARDTGICTISSKVNLVQEADSNKQAGFLMWLPVYKKGALSHSDAERHANLIGWVGASFRMDDFMATIFDRNDSRLDIEIYDGTEILDQNLMHDADNIRRDTGSYDSRYQNISTLNISGHNWTLVLSSLPGFDERLNEQKPRLIAMAGGTISILLALITLILVYSRNRVYRYMQALNRELTERKRAEADMRLAATVFDTVDAAVLVTDKDNKIIKVNPAFTVITGYTPEEAVGRNTGMLSSGAHPPAFYEAMWKSLKQTGSWQGEISNRRKNGEFYIEWLAINEVRDNEDNVTHHVAMFSDISERKAAEAQMHNLAHYDPLTGLPNRTLLSDRLQQAITAAKREKSHMALMFLDLDKFKPINDTLGHHIGDLLLKEVAKRILACMRESDTAARIGGDEFVLLLPSIEAVDDALSVAEKIRDALYQPFELSGHSLNISSSIGVAVYPEHGLDEKSLLKNADTAMYYAKEAGRNTVMLFVQTMKKSPQ